MATAVRRPDGSTTDPAALQTLWKDRIQRARDARKKYEPTWLSNLAFAAGQHWLVYDEIADMLRHVKHVDPRRAEQNLLTDDRISEYRDTQLGELDSDDDRPQLLVAQESESAEGVAKLLNEAIGYAWDHEWQAETVLSQVYEGVVDLGTIAIRLRREKEYGQVVDHQPFDPSGKVVTQETHPQDWQALEQTGAMADGSLPNMQPIREGRTCLDFYTPFGVLAPPGVNHEDKFPWEVLVRPYPLDDLQAEYPAAKDLTEDGDIASAMGLTTGQTVRDSRSQGNNTSGRLRGQVWLYTCFDRPCPKYPEGRVTVIASNDYKVLDVQEGLDYELPNGESHTGVIYFHWRRLLDRFYSRAWIEPLKDPQRALNNDVTVSDEIVARGGPKVFLREQDLVENPQGLPMEVVRMKDNAQPPFFFQGIGLPPALAERRQALLDNLAHAATISDVRLGINPQNADTYSALALLNENESGKRSYIRRAHKRSIARLVELGVHDIRKYWPEEKQILVVGDEDVVTKKTFAKAQIPDFYMAKVAKGAPQPRSQAAELKKIDAFWAAAEQSGLVASDPASWVSWYVESTNAGSAQEIPEPQTDSQTQMAEYENLLMRYGEDVIPADYDLLPVHLPKHREEQDRARAEGDMDRFLRVQTHIDLSVQVQQENAARVASAAQAPSPLAPPPGAPVSGPPSPAIPPGQ